MPSGYPDSRWALTPPFHPCLCPCGPSAVSFCCTVCPGFSRFPSLTFMRRVALWCPDFPHLPLARKLRPSGERRGETVLRGHSFQAKAQENLQALDCVQPAAAFRPCQPAGGERREFPQKSPLSSMRQQAAGIKAAAGCRHSKPRSLPDQKHIQEKPAYHHRPDDHLDSHPGEGADD